MEATKGKVAARRLRRAVTRRVVAANGIGAVFAGLNINPSSEAQVFDSADIASFGVLIGYLGIAIPVATRIGWRLAAPIYAWVEAGGPPSPEQLRSALAQPWLQALSAFGFWAAAAVLFGLFNLTFDPTGAASVFIVLGILLSGLAAGAVTYLLNDRLLRPVFAIALTATDSPEPVATLGLGPRLMLSWAISAGIPLLSISLVLLGSPQGPYTTALIAFDVVAGLVVGWWLMRAAARTVTEPIASVRSSLGRVARGDLDAEVAVTDGGEIGFLERGVNLMVHGLRERRRLEDLFGRHVGEEVARRALDEGVSLGGELREATALFVDLTGSTTITHAHEPTDVVSMLNDFFDAVVRVTQAEGGLVNKFAGDGALCIFGAPADQSDHAARALRAARALDEAIRRLGLDAGIGVASGKVVAGNVGAADRYEYTVIGDAVNVASRLTDEAKARPGRVLAAAQTVALAGGDGWRPAGSFDLRGRPEPVPACEPDG